MRVAALALACGLLAGCATSAPLAPGAHYAALGSSFAAGAGIPPLATDRPERCGASQVSYARLLADRLGLDLTDASCGGATTAHVLGPWNELPPQIEAVRLDTRLVTITIGGNDLAYMGVMFAASCHAGMRDTRLVDPATGECREPVLPEPARVQALEDDLARLLSEIRVRAPRARVVLVQYVALAGDSDCAAAPLSPEHAAIAQGVAAALAEASERAAERAGAEVLAMDEFSANHTPCDPEPWAHGLGDGFDPAQGAPWHPSREGHAAIAQELARLLNADEV
ncbi:MAG: SGNH/GDSL hydrolase family protein [Erythrobacter sp.]|nr:MAG: SGNH/GDSL hydrolase family protein [Erythrobacter sp.]